MNLEVEYSVAKDTKTYVDLVYRFKALRHGREDIQESLLLKLEPDLQGILRSAETEEAAYKGVFDYLKNSYEKDPTVLDTSVVRLRDRWGKVGANIIYSLEFMYKKPFPFETVTAYLTTNNIFPYNYGERYFFANFRYLLLQLNIAKHELSHFMFYYYYPELKERLGREKYELLKESLSFFSNPEQFGKPNEKVLRELYKSRIWEGLEEAIEAGAKLSLEV